MRYFILASLLLPTTALAQPVEPPPPDPAPVPAPAPVPEAAPVPDPAPAPAPVPNEPPEPQNHKHGLTFEANLGVALMWATANGNTTDKEGALGGLNLGLGGWINPRVAVSLRIGAVTYSESAGDARLTTAFVGPSVQYWATDHLWLGGGVGVGVIRVSDREGAGRETGMGFDVRAGYTFSTTSEDTLNISLELIPTRFAAGSEDLAFYGLGLLLGYQHL